MFKNNNPLLIKGLFAIAIVAIAGIVGTVNYASAQVASGQTKPSKTQCVAAGYTNYGSCVRVWAQDKSGYGRLGQ